MSLSSHYGQKDAVKKAQVFSKSEGDRKMNDVLESPFCKLEKSRKGTITFSSRPKSSVRII